uniref:NADH dehydrogenase [ubiquinone] 1 beta subcomplex subunit 11, mitochondrial n=1 Tax=Timema genevievae TaxID=629358 RepID=A0A7R9JS95_TIMGE|nr:unnamed protein product [Timema genevievae]
MDSGASAHMTNRRDYFSKCEKTVDNTSVVLGNNQDNLKCHCDVGFSAFFTADFQSQTGTSEPSSQSLQKVLNILNHVRIQVFLFHLLVTILIDEVKSNEVKLSSRERFRDATFNVVVDSLIAELQRRWYAYKELSKSFIFAYVPDFQLRDWAQREAFLELRRREQLGLPPIDRNLIDPEKIILPTDEELGDTEIII